MQAFFIERQSGPCFPVVDTGDAYDLVQKLSRIEP